MGRGDAQTPALDPLMPLQGFVHTEDSSPRMISTDARCGCGNWEGGYRTMVFALPCGVWDGARNPHTRPTREPSCPCTSHLDIFCRMQSKVLVYATSSPCKAIFRKNSGLPQRKGPRGLKLSPCREEAPCPNCQPPSLHRLLPRRLIFTYYGIYRYSSLRPAYLIRGRSDLVARDGH